MRIKSFISLVVAFSLVLTLTAFADNFIVPTQNIKGQLVIIHTSNTNGRDLQGVYTTAAIAQLKKEYKKAGADVLLLSAGDVSLGLPVVSYNQGKNAIKFMNYAGYDAMAIGHHEFVWGVDNTKILEDVANFPLLGANVVSTKNSAIIFQDRTIIETDSGLKVGIFGLSCSENQTKVDPSKIKDVTFLSGARLYSVAQVQVDSLKSQGADYIIALSHLSNSVSNEGNRTSDVLANVTGIDLVIDAHGDTQLESGALIGETMVVYTEENLNSVGVVAVNGQETTVTQLGANANKTPVYSGSDINVLHNMKVANAEVDVNLSQTFAQTMVTLNGTQNPGLRTQETNLGDFVADAMLWSAKQTLGENKVDMAIVNGGGIRGSISKGPITMKTLKTILPFEDQLTTVTLSGYEILSALEAATSTTPEPSGAFPQVAGITFTIDTTKAYEKGAQYGSYDLAATPGTRVTDVVIAGKNLELNKQYVVATSGFIVAGGDSYAIFRNKTTKATGLSLEAAVIKYSEKALAKQISKEQYSEAANRINIIYEETAPEEVQTIVNPLTGLIK